MAEKPGVKYKLLQDAKERGGLGLPDLKLHFIACCLMWIIYGASEEQEDTWGWKDVISDLGDTALCIMTKFSIDFQNHFVRYAIMSAWNSYKVR